MHGLPWTGRLDLHGAAVRLDLSAPILQPMANHLLRPFVTSAAPNRVPACYGTVQPFDEVQVLRSIHPKSRPLGRTENDGELFGFGDSYWLIDDRWGICELNLLKQTWRSWILPQPACDALRCVEAAVLWPMAQLLKPRGLHLIRSVGVERDGWTALILCPFSIGREISRLADTGYRFIGQRWTVLSVQGPRLKLLGFPGLTENPDVSPANLDLLQETVWVDLAAGNVAQARGSRDCHAVFAIAGGRRARTRGVMLNQASSAIAALRRAWPSRELPLHRRRGGDPVPLLSSQCRCVSVELSRHPDDLTQLIESARRREADLRRIQVTLGTGASALAGKKIVRRRARFTADSLQV